MSNEMKLVINEFDNVVKEIQSMKAKSEKIVNRTVSDFKSRGPSWVAQEVTKEYNISKKDVNECGGKPKKGRSKVRVKGTKLDNLMLVYQGRLLTLPHFNMTPTKPPKLLNERMTVHLPGAGFRSVRKRAKVKVEATIYKGKKEVITGKYGTPVFIQQNPKKAGQYLPFQRTGKTVNKTGKDELTVIRSISVPQMITNEKVSENIHDRINTELGKRLQHHLKQAMK